MYSKSKTVLLTGGTRGLGFATARMLAKRGYFVLLTGRNKSAAQAAAAKIQAEFPEAPVPEGLSLDLSSLGAVRRFVEVWEKRAQRIDVLFNCAGILEPEPGLKVTQDGFEPFFGVNHLGHYLLTRSLLPWLSIQPSSRVVQVSSRLHQASTGFGRAATLDFDEMRSAGFRSPHERYKASKLANLLFVYELERRVGSQGIHANGICPGFIPETIAEHRKGIHRWFYRACLRRMPFARGLNEAAGHFVDLATDPAFDGIGGRFFADGREVTSSPASYDPDLARRLWDVSAQFCGLQP